MFKGHIITGTVEGTGAAINVETGFKPSRVEILNEAADISLLWTDTMDDAAGLKTLKAGSQAFIAANGVTPYAGTRGDTSAGFTIGTDSVNVSGNTLHYTVWGSDG